MSKAESDTPFGGLFGLLGLFLGFVYGAGLGSGNWIVALGGAFVGAWLGYLVEHILARLFLIALFVFLIIARQAFFEAIFENAALMPLAHDEAIVLMIKPKAGSWS